MTALSFAFVSKGSRPRDVVGEQCPLALMSADVSWTLPYVRFWR